MTPHKPRGGGDTHRLRGDKGIVVYVTPEQYERLKAAAAASGETLKAYCTTAALARAGIEATPRPDLRGRPGASDSKETSNDET